MGFAGMIIIFYSSPTGNINASKLKLIDPESAQDRIQKYRVIMDSITYNELENPDLINAKVIRRVSMGSGKTEQDVRALLKEFKSPVILSMGVFPVFILAPLLEFP